MLHQLLNTKWPTMVFKTADGIDSKFTGCYYQPFMNLFWIQAAILWEKVLREEKNMKLLFPVDRLKVIDIEFVWWVGWDG